VITLYSTYFQLKSEYLYIGTLYFSTHFLVNPSQLSDDLGLFEETHIVARENPDAQERSTPGIRMWNIAGMLIVERNYALVVNPLLWTILALDFFTTRLFTRAHIVKRVGIDNYLMVAAMVD
jgi:hypothetical protein